jgi:hypothetical protein
LIILKLSAKNRHIQYSLGALERQYAELLLLFAVIFFLIFSFVIAPITGGVLLALARPSAWGMRPSRIASFSPSTVSFVSGPPTHRLSPSRQISPGPPRRRHRTVVNFAYTLTNAKGSMGRSALPSHSPSHQW